MRIAETALVVKGKRCPCACDGNGALMYIACPTCHKILLMCDEIGNVFDNLAEPLKSKDTLVIWKSSNQVCPHCKETHLSSFVPALEAQLQELGLNDSEYEAAESHVISSFRRFVGA